MSEESLPEGWARLSLADAGAWSAGGTPSRKVSAYFGGGIPWVKSGDLNDSVVTSVEETLSQSGLQNSSAKVLPKGTVSIAMYGATIGKTGIFGLDAATNQACANCRVHEGLVDRKFLLYFLQSQKDEFVGAGQGGAQPNISATILKAWPFLLAPLPEQHRIVEKVEALLEQVNRAKARLDRVPLILKRFRQAVLAAACSGELTREWREEHPEATLGTEVRARCDAAWTEPWPDIPQSWGWARVERLLLDEGSLSYGILKPGEFVQHGVPMVRVMDIEGNAINLSQVVRVRPEVAKPYSRTKLVAGDVLLTVMATVGRAAVVPPELTGANVNRAIAVLRVERRVLEPEYLVALLESPFFQTVFMSEKIGSAQARINIGDLRAFTVPVPPIGEQCVLLQRLAQMDRLRITIERRVQAATARANKLPQAILSKAFSGELVPTEAELARLEGRTYETAEELLKRVTALGSDAPSARKGRGRRTG